MEKLNYRKKKSLRISREMSPCAIYEKERRSNVLYSSRSVAKFHSFEVYRAHTHIVGDTI